MQQNKQKKYSIIQDINYYLVCMKHKYYNLYVKNDLFNITIVFKTKYVPNIVYKYMLVNFEILHYNTHFINQELIYFKLKLKIYHSYYNFYNKIQSSSISFYNLIFNQSNLYLFFFSRLMNLYSLPIYSSIVSAVFLLSNINLFPGSLCGLNLNKFQAPQATANFYYY